MKKLFAMLLMLSITAIATAQAKVGYVAFAELVDSLSAKAKIEQQIKAFEKPFVDSLKNIQVNFVNSNPTDRLRFTETDRKLELEKLIATQKLIERCTINAQKQMAAMRIELLKPLRDSVLLAINQIAKVQGYNYVLDSSNKTFVVSPPQDDLTPLVKQQLDIK